MSAVGIDVGTTVVKAVGYDDAGRPVHVARGGVPVDRPRPGWAEQDMLAVRDAVLTTAREVVAALRDAGTTPDLLAVTAQGDGAWLVDTEGAPTGPAPLWNDGRAAPVLARWAGSGLEEQVARTTASRPSTGMAAPLLTWFDEHDPDRLARSATILSCSGWLLACLTGRRVGDLSGAVSVIDAASGDYAAGLLDSLGLAHLRRLLPELVGDRPGENPGRVGRLGAASAQALSLPAGTPVVLAPYDIAATALGAGAVEPGDAVCILGTTLCPELVVDAVPPAVRTGITVAAGSPGRWLRAFPTMAGGDVLEWASKVLHTGDVAGLVSLAAESVRGARGVTFLPYLSPAGERNPFTDTAARGSLHGLSLEHERADVARAVLEGLTMTIRDCLAAADQAPASLAVCGGGSASATWVQLMADVTGLPVRRCADDEVGARGAVLAGLVATGAEPDLRSAVAGLPAAGEPTVPDPAAAQHYAQAHEQLVSLREVVRTTWASGGES